VRPGTAPIIAVIPGCGDPLDGEALTLDVARDEVLSVAVVREEDTEDVPYSP
jgi:hypothetical protein